MAVTKLSLYNDALLLTGERRLATATDAVPSRYELDIAYDDPAAADYCLELAKPKFSLLTAKLSSPVTPTNHALANEYTLPSDYISIYKAYSEAELDNEIHRYIIEAQTIACDVATNIWLRYVSNGRALTIWTPSFAGVVSAYLAKSIAPRFAPQKLISLEDLFLSRVNATIQLEGIKEDEPRAVSATATIDDTLRKVYNDAFFILGLDQITSNSDDSDRRSKADVAMGTGLVATVLEDTGWSFGITSNKADYNPSYEPGWGYSRGYDKPSDMHRLDGLFQDPHFRVPLKDYADEGDVWYCDIDEIYIQYVNTSYLTTASAWPQYFANQIAAELAVRLAPTLAPELIDHALEIFEDRKGEAGGVDAMSGPPQRIKSGQWVRSRWSQRRSNAYDGRP